MKSQFKLQLALVIAGLALMLCLAPRTNGQASSGGNYTITQNVVAGGGASSTGGQFELLGTAAQHDAAESAGGIFKVEGGFWPGDQVFSTPPPPPACSVDITAQMDVVSGGVALDLLTRHAKQTITLTYRGTSTITTPMVLAIDNLTPGVVVFQPAGTTSCAAPKGSPYVNLSAGQDNQLDPGETITVTLEFAISGTLQSLSYSPRVLTGSSW